MTFMINTICFMKLILLIAVAVAQRTEPPLYQDEEPVPEVCKYLIETDKQLVEKYQSKPKGDGEAIMALVRNYNDNLALLIKRAKYDMKQGINDTITEAKALIDHGGPEFINFYVERPILEERFGLNNVSSRILQCQRQNTVDIWEDFYKMYSKIADDDDES